MASQLVRWHFLSPLGLIWDGFLSDQITLLLVILGEGIKILSLNVTLYPDIIFLRRSLEV